MLSLSLMTPLQPRRRTSVPHDTINAGPRCERSMNACGRAAHARGFGFGSFEETLAAPVALHSWHDHRAAGAIFLLVMRVAHAHGIRPGTARTINPHTARRAPDHLAALRGKFLCGESVAGRGLLRDRRRNLQGDERSGQQRGGRQHPKLRPTKLKPHAHVPISPLTRSGRNVSDCGWRVNRSLEDEPFGRSAILVRFKTLAECINFAFAAPSNRDKNRSKSGPAN